jgi:hypothetical protein
MSSWPVLGTLILSLFSATSVAGDTKVPQLTGTWVVGGSSACRNADNEYFEFRNNTTFETRIGSEIVATGFWTLDGDIATLHSVAEPAMFSEQLSDYK